MEPGRRPRRRAAASLALLGLACVVLAGCTTPQAYKDYFGRPEELVAMRDVGRGDFEFLPMNLTVTVNTTVVWLNEDTVTDHTVTFEDRALDAWVEPGERVERKFTEPGVYDYRCRPHSTGYRNWDQMVGRITVVAGQPEATAVL